MPAGLHSDGGKQPRRVPEERADCARDFRLQFGRTMTKREQGFLELGNAVCDSHQQQHPQERVCVGLIERARRTCEYSRKLISSAIETITDSKALVASAHLVSRKQKNRLRPAAYTSRW